MKSDIKSALYYKCMHTGVGTFEDLCRDQDSTPEMPLETSQRTNPMLSDSFCNNNKNKHTFNGPFLGKPVPER